MSSSTTDRSRTILWCVPRSVSCAVTRCLSAIKDIDVWYEPFFFSYATSVNYKTLTGQELPKSYGGNEETFRHAADLLQDLSHLNFKPDYLPYGSVKQRLENLYSQHVFVKDIGCAIGKGDLEYLPAGYKHTFLIRHPAKVLRSNRAAMFEQLSQLGALKDEAANENTFDLEHDDPYMTPGLLFKDLYDVWQHVRKNANSEPIVIDADDLLTKPAEMLPKYCSAVGLPYDESLLNLSGPSELDVFKIWKSPIGSNELQMTVNAFSNTAMNSTAFNPPKDLPEPDQLTSDVIRSVDQIMEYYDEMYQHRMKI